MIEVSYFDKRKKTEDPIIIEIENKYWLSKFFDAIIQADDNETVYLYSSELKSNLGFKDVELNCEIIVEDNPLVLKELALCNSDFEYRNIFLQGYESFEDAYSVALSMREFNPLCYNKD